MISLVYPRGLERESEEWRVGELRMERGVGDAMSRANRQPRPPEENQNAESLRFPSYLSSRA